MQIHEASIHGRRVVYRTAGDDGPVLVLIHGITQDSTTWEQLARHVDGLRLIAIDLPGHGKSENPPGDHSMGAYASTVRDLMILLGHGSGTLVGHSLGGGIALQFAYQFPEMVDRLVLIDSGGLGVEVSPLLRAASLPGADPVIALLSTDAVKQVAASVSKGLQRLGLRLGTDLAEVWRGLDNLADPTQRHAFLRTVRGAIGLGGQRISASDKLYLAEHVPTLLIWGARDRIIPLTHATDAHEAIPGSTLRVLRDAGHFPHLEAPRTVADHIEEFVENTEPAAVPREEWGQLLKAERLESA
ncbi:MAG: alpha/beta fold hydrolase [Nitriliruptorales bacterium]|nr:alpha/beta fold hydrolase [Nitriliruptorales bacterium]